MDLNRATIIGRLTRDPEVRTTPNGQSVASLSLATNRIWTDNNGVKQERVEYHNCVLWGKLAEIAGNYLAKGRRVYLEGRIETRDWTGQDGVKRYRTEIVAENLIMLDSGSKSGDFNSGNNSSVPTIENSPIQNNGDDEIKVEDIPF
ncbi:MAG: single-stranded DNA-binding protein [Patescibacteria group bacterium]